MLSDIEIYKQFNKKRIPGIITACLLALSFIVFALFTVAQYEMIYFYTVLAISLILIFGGIYLLFKSFSVYKKLEKLQKTGIKTEGMFEIIDITHQARGPGFAATLSGEIMSPVTGAKQLVKSNRFGGISWGEPNLRGEPYGRDDIADIKRILQKPVDVYVSPDGADYIVNIAPIHRFIFEKDKNKWKLFSKTMLLCWGIIAAMWAIILFFILSAR